MSASSDVCGGRRLPPPARPGWTLLLALGLWRAGVAAGPEHACAVLQGVVVDQAGGAPLALSHVQIRELRLGTVSGPAGEFLLHGVPAGTWTLDCTQLGYEPWQRRLLLPASDTLRVEVRLRPRTLALEELTVTEGAGRLPAGRRPVLEVRQAELQQKLGLTLAGTLQGETGVEQRSMGPGPARPVLRGLSGDRLLIQEDGAGMGDLSAGSADHAVALDPINSERVTLLRGAQALLASSAAVGGVIDVERGLIPRSGLSRVEGGATLTGESGSGAWGGAASLSTPGLGLDWRADGSWRRAGDQRTPGGRLGNSTLAMGAGGLGASAALGHWLAGLGAATFRNEYGIPGGFAGAHPRGVDIELERHGLQASLAWTPDRAEDPDHGLRGLTLHSQSTQYRHVELESSGAVGMSFDQLSQESRLDLRLGHHGPFQEGWLRVQQSWRRLRTGGLTHTPSTVEEGLGLATLQQIQAGALQLEGALRGDWRRIRPVVERRNIVVGHIRSRAFAGASGALTASWAPADAAGGARSRWTPGLSLILGWRPPTVNELFSGGPHLAAYSYEIGNPELGPERSRALEGFLQLDGPGRRGRLAVFATDFQGFLFPSYTGRFSPRRADLYEYRTLGRDARFLGVEAELEREAGHWTVEASGAWLRGSLRGGGPLPAIPPLKGRLRLARRLGAWEAETRLEAAGAQARVYRAEDPGAVPESATAGWARLDLGLTWQGGARRSRHQLSLQLLNALDQEYRDHLNRVRVVLPEAGRNLKVVWKVWV
ncbi:MAG: TonB-dependent receptor [Candidatus Delongbacteria bacterium]